MIIGQECGDCGEVFDEDIVLNTCPFCSGKILEIQEFICKSCGRVFETSEYDLPCPYCESHEIDLIED